MEQPTTQPPSIAMQLAFKLKSSPCPICGQPSTDQFNPSTFNPWVVMSIVDRDNAEEQAKQLISSQVKHFLDCSLKKAEELSIDISDMFVKDVTIREVEFDQSDDDDDEDYIEEDDDCMETDSDDEEEENKVELMEELESRLLAEESTTTVQPESNNNNINGSGGDGCNTTNNAPLIRLKFKFMSGLVVEGNFKSTDAIHFVVRWLSIKTEIVTNCIALRVNDQLFENGVVLANNATLDELKIKSGTLIQCYCRDIG